MTVAADSTGIKAPVEETIDGLLDAPGTAWAVGILGALAEFSRLPGDGVRRLPGRVLRSRLGALRIDTPAGLLPVAYEGLMARADGWSQTLAFCLPETAARGPARTVLTELGPDPKPLDPAAGDALLFDLGLGSPWIEACVRTADPALVDIFRARAGRSVLEPDCPAMAAIKRTSPTRVFRSVAARIEVHQPIGSTARGIPTPEGPHTHLLPSLLRTGRSHAATAPLPAGMVPVLWCYPETPLGDRERNDRSPAFDHARHAAFQALVDRFGPPGYAAEKRRIADAVRAGGSPADYSFPESRTGRLAAKVALRQLVHDDAPPGLDAWRAAFDRTTDREDPHAAVAPAVHKSN